jgi:hypothetical protein
MKRRLILLLCVLATLSVHAQYTQTDRIVRDGLTGLNAVLGSIERQKMAKLEAEQKAQNQPIFNEAYETAKEYEDAEMYEEALQKYEEAATLNCQYGYTDQKVISKKITSLYEKAGREEDGPSILNNHIVTLDDYSAYRYMKVNPIAKTKKKASTATKLIRVCCSDQETRLEFETEAKSMNYLVNVVPRCYIKGNEGDKLELTEVQNITTSPTRTIIPFTYQKLRFALIFEPLPVEATEFDFVEPGGIWKFMDIKCK